MMCVRLLALHVSMPRARAEDFDLNSCETALLRVVYYARGLFSCLHI